MRGIHVSTRECWLPAPGYEGLYEVSDCGRVRSIPRTNTRGGLMKPHTNKEGYAQLTLYRDGQPKLFKIHRLVLETFVSPREHGQQCRHLDGDQLNNQLANLAWGTHSENQLDRVRHGTHHLAARVACPAGHAYDRRDSRGSRICLTCQRDYARRRRSTLHQLDERHD